jgi:hypothetical protein
MHQITYAQRLEGRLTTIGPGLADVVLAATGETPMGRGAVLASQLAFATEQSFREEGTISFEDGTALRLRTLGRGELTRSPADGLRHGTAVLAVEGVGRLSGTCGRITSNFLVGDDGAVTDEQVVVLFIDEGGKDE